MEAEDSDVEFENRLLKFVLPRRILDLGRVNLRGDGAAKLLCSFFLIAYS